MPKGSLNDHKTRGNNTEWKFKDNKWAFKNKYNGWSDFHVVNIHDKTKIVWCDQCFDEKSSFTDFIDGYPSIIIDHLVDKINQLEKENLKLKLVEKENEIQKLKNENNYINQIKKYENEIQTLKNDNSNLISTIKLFEKNLKIEDNKINEFLMPVIFQSVDSKIHYAIICKNTDRFNMIENILYDKYPEYIENENYFIVNGIKINKNKTMEQNNIKYSDIITLNTQQ